MFQLGPERSWVTWVEVKARAVDAHSLSEPERTMGTAKGGVRTLLGVEVVTDSSPRSWFAGYQCS